MILNESEQEKFKLLFTVIRNKNLDHKNIKNIKDLPEFLDCIDLLNKKIGSKLFDSIFIIFLYKLSASLRLPFLWFS